MIRSRKEWWLSLAVVVASLVGGSPGGAITSRRGCACRAVLTADTASDDGALYVEGFSPDGSMLVARILQSSADAIGVWDVATGKLLKILRTQKGDAIDENGRPPRRQDPSSSEER